MARRAQKELAFAGQSKAQGSPRPPSSPRDVPMQVAPPAYYGCAHACADCLLTESELAAGGTHAAQARNRDHHIERSEVGHPG